jgi:hypothetical protein
MVNEVLENVSHRHVVINLPKILRPYFNFNRKLLTQLSRFAYQSTLEVMRTELGQKKWTGASVNVIHTYGTLLNWAPLPGILEPFAL